MNNEKTLILIDGHALAFRQYFALERTNMKTTDGTPSWGVYGFFKSVFDLLKNNNLKPDAIAVAFDVSHKTFRVDKYPEYKSNRRCMPDPMKIQMDLIYEGLKAFNIPIYTKEGFEADDVIGTISKKACELGHKVLILTGDQDAFQLVDKEGCTKVILPSKGELIEYNWDRIYEKLGVYPDQVIDYKALRGDTSDCIPGIRGIGEKTAQRLLTQYGTLENVLANGQNIPEAAIRCRICGGVEAATLSKYLATIIRDVDIDFDFSLTNLELPDVKAVTAFLKKMQFYSFLKNINSILTAFDKSGNLSAAQNMENGDQQQLGLFSEAVKAEINKIEIQYDKKYITTAEDLHSMIEELKSQQFFTFKMEGVVKSAVETEIAGFAFAYCEDYKVKRGKIIFEGDGKNCPKTFYIPVNVEDGLDKDFVISVLKPLFEDDNVKKVTHDLKVECNSFRSHGIELKGVIFDTMLASYVKEPSRNQALDIQSIERLNHVMNEFAPYESNRRKRITILQAKPENAFNFAVDEVATILDLTKYWVKELDEKELKLISDIELPLACVLSDMEYTGVSIDVEYLNELTKTMDTMIHKIESKIYQLADEGFNLNSPRQVGEILFDKLKIDSKKKGKGKNKYSTSAEILEELAPEHEIVDLILKYRKYTKLKSTYSEALPGLINPIDGRLHTTYNQTVTATGRLSSSNPNLQNIPIRTEEGNKIRKAFIPRDKRHYVILSADYSQIELRLLAHVTKDKNLIKAFTSDIDIHTLTASKVFDVPVEEVTKEMRYKSKAVNFGIIYGQSRYGLAKALGITWEEAEEFINKYFKTYPRVKTYMKRIVDLARKQGYVESTFGRKRRLDNEFDSVNNQIREFAKRAAINHPMQGTAADLIKIAMIELYKKLKENNLKSKMIMQVHDELVLEVEKSELEQVTKLVIDAMELNQPLLVPLKIDINVGASWKEQ